MNSGFSVVKRVVVGGVVRETAKHNDSEGASVNPSGVDDVSNGVPCTDRELVSAVETVAGVYGVVAA